MVSKENDFKKNVRIYANNDEKMRELGNILSTTKSRTIYQILIEKELNAKEIGKLLELHENPRLPNLIYHLDKMVKVGLLTVKKRQQRKRGHILKYYKAIPLILILPPANLEKASNSKSLFNILERLLKFTTSVVLMMSFSTFFKQLKSFIPIILKLKNLATKQ